MGASTYIPLRPEDIHSIAELAVEKYGRKASDRDTAIPLTTELMKDFGCTDEQIANQRIEVSREIMNIRRTA